MKNLLLKLFPFENYEIVTQLTKEAIFKRLESAYDPNYPPIRLKSYSTALRLPKDPRAATTAIAVKAPFPPLPTQALIKETTAPQ